MLNADRFMELYSAGLSDHAIARECGISASYAHHCRRKLGLPANFPPVTKSKPCGERVPERLRPRLRLLLLAIKHEKRHGRTKAWEKCWQYFRWLEGRPDAPAWGGRR